MGQVLERNKEKSRDNSEISSRYAVRILHHISKLSLCHAPSLIQPNIGPLPPLPSFVTIRTPSPELLGTFVQRQAPKDVHFLVQQLFQTTVVGLQPLSELDLSSLNETSHKSTCPTPDSVYKLCLQGIPFTILLENMSGMLQFLLKLFTRQVANNCARLPAITVRNCQNWRKSSLRRPNHSLKQPPRQFCHLWAQWFIGMPIR